MRLQPISQQKAQLDGNYTYFPPYTELLCSDL